MDAILTDMRGPSEDKVVASVKGLGLRVLGLGLRKQDGYVCDNTVCVTTFQIWRGEL